MPLETGIGVNSLPDELNAEWPLGSDPKSEGDDHIRNLKTVLANFYGRMNYDSLPFGTIAATFNGVRDPSGMVSKGGGIDVSVPMDLEAAFVRDLVTGGNTYAPIVFSPVGTNSRPYHVKTEPFGPIDGQMVDTETSTGPIEVIVPVQTAMLTKTITIRGAVEVDRVRLTIRENDANGRILVQTAKDQELINNGGFLINDVADTVITLSQYWPSISGDMVHILFERYEPASGTIVSSGIALKGATILGDFVPYFNRSGYRYSLVPLKEDTDFYLEGTSTVPLAGVLTTILETMTFPARAGKTYRFKINLLARSSGGLDAVANISFSHAGTPVNHDGAGNLGQLYIRQTATAVPVTFNGSFVAATDGDIVLKVSGLLVARNIDILRSTLEVEIVE